MQRHWIPLTSLRTVCILTIALGVFVISLGNQTTSGQQVNVQTPLTQASDSYWEFWGTHWGFNRSGPNGYFFFDNGGYNGATPPFGGYDPNQLAHFGFGNRTPNSGFFFDMVGGQGSQRTVTGVAPNLTYTNGVPGFIFDGQVSPFVVGVVPVVGGANFGGNQVPYATGYVPITRGASPVAERIARLQSGEGRSRQRETPPAPDADANADSLSLRGEKSTRSVSATTSGYSTAIASSAERGDVSLAEIRRQQAAEESQREEELEAIVAKAKQAEANGKYSTASIYYRQAANRAEGPRRRELLKKADSLRN